MQVLFDLSTVLAEAHPTANAAISLAMQIMDCIDLKSDLSVQWAHNLVSAFFHRNGDQICEKLLFPPHIHRSTKCAYKYCGFLNDNFLTCKLYVSF